MSDESTRPAATLDRTTLDRLRKQGGRELVAEIVTIYLSDLDSLTKRIHAAVRSADDASLATCAHALKGCSASMGARQIWMLCQELEQAAIARDFSRASEVLADLDSQAQLVRVELEGESARA
jgi:histidine phosphotransfer protein HptB